MGIIPKQTGAAWIEHCCWPDCQRERYEASDSPPLCIQHLIECAHYIQERVAGFNLLGSPHRNMVPLPSPDLPATSVVYYVRMGNHVKIGTTINLAARLKSLYVDHDPDAVLATEPGDASLEKHRHFQFSDERIYRNRELFNPSPRLLAHIEALNRVTTQAG